jgi:DNA-binding Lrp family transcriptional regulator
MDAKDKRILKELIVNSRIPISMLAKKVGVGREVALYRINNLKKSVIIGFFTNINYKLLGFKRYGCYLQLKGITSEKEAKFFEYLNDHPFVTYFGPVIGKWNVVFDILSRDEQHLQIIVAEIKSNIKEYLESFVIASTGLEEEIYPTKFVEVIINQRPKKIPDKKINIDDVDNNILKLLATNSRIEYSELSKKLKLSANAIKYRIKNLEKSQAILGYTISVDYTKLDLQCYCIQFKTQGDNQRFISYLRSHKRVIMYYKHLGQENWDLDIGILVKDAMELREFMIEVRNSFETLKIHDMYLVTHIIKDNIAPEGIFYS